MSDAKNGTMGQEGESRFAELEEIRREVEKRLRDNRRFLETFMNDTIPEDEEDDAGDGEEFFEEL